MNQAQSKTPNRITVLVFKDHLAARAFHVPIRWVSQLGALIGLFLIFSTLMCVFAGRYYRMASKTQAAETQAPLLAPVNSLSLSQQKAQNQPAEAGSTMPDQLETQTPSPNSPNEANLNPESQSQPLQGILFTGLSTAGTQATPIPDPSSLAFSIRNPRYSWQNGTLQVRFALQYTRSDRGSQQGKIIVLARGPSTLLSFPSGTLNPTGMTTLIDYSKGEFFSVSRFREGVATFSSLPSKSLVKEIEILILSKSGELLLHQSFPLTEPAPRTPEAEPSDQEDS